MIDSRTKRLASAKSKQAEVANKALRGWIRMGDDVNAKIQLQHVLMLLGELEELLA